MSSYASPTDLVTYALPPLAVRNVSTSVQQAELDAASDVADSYLRGRYALPLSAPYPTDLVRHVCYVAAFNLIASIGFNPAAGADQLIRQRYYEAVGNPQVPGSVGWFGRVQRQEIHPAVIPAVAQPGDPVHDLPQVSTSPQRGWQATNRRGTPVVG